MRTEWKPYCKYFRVRTHQNEKYGYCFLNKQVIHDECVKCLKFNPRENKGIKKRSSKLTKIEKDRYSILTDDLKHCYICKLQGKEVTKDDLHEIYPGRNRVRSMKNGFVVPLCRRHHEDINVLHNLKILCQEYYEKTNSRESFLEIIGKNYREE